MDTNAQTATASLDADVGTSRCRLLPAVLLVLVGLAAACGGDGGSGVGAASGTTAAADAPASTIDDAWRDQALALCDATAEGVATIAPPSSPEDVARTVDEYAALHDDVADLVPTDLPPELQTPPTDLPVLLAEGAEWIDRAVEQAAAGELAPADGLDGPKFSDTASGSLDRFTFGLAEVATVLAGAGVPCGPADPTRAAEADLNVPVAAGWQIATGFDSVWVSQLADHTVVRLDPQTGVTQAAIDVGALPFKLQSADGRMIVRTDEAYVAIDPETNTVADTLPMSEVGPSAGRAWAVDGGLWICDGSRLHRYDPADFEPLAAVELDFTCGQVLATEDLVVAWTYDEDEAQSGASIAGYVDPATDTLVATTALPADVNVPVVLDDAVYFPPNPGTHPPVLVDRGNWSVSTAPDLGGQGSTGSQPAYDGTSIYVIVDKHDVAVVDPTSFEVTDTIPAFDLAPPADGHVNAIAIGPGALWVVNGQASVVQRFDRPE